MPLDEDSDCPRCHRITSTDEGCEPTEFCHQCAQEIAAAACELVRLPNIENRCGPWKDVNNAMIKLKATIKPKS